MYSIRGISKSISFRNFFKYVLKFCKCKDGNRLGKRKYKECIDKALGRV